MGEKVNLVLSITKKIRNSTKSLGHILLEGECARDITPADLDKAIKLQEVNVEVVKQAAENKKNK